MRSYKKPDLQDVKLCLEDALVCDGVLWYSYDDGDRFNPASSVEDVAKFLAESLYYSNLITYTRKETIITDEDGIKIVVDKYCKN